MPRSDINTVLAFAVPVIVGFVVWLIQRSINDKATKRLKEKADSEAERAGIAEERRNHIAEEHRLVLNRLDELERQGSSDSQTLALLKQEMLPMAEAMKRKLVDILSHPSDEFKIPDKLLAQIMPVGSSLPSELESLLRQRVRSKNPHVTEQEKLAAQALPIIVKMAELEALRAPDAEVTAIQLVTSTAKSTATKKQEEG